VNRIAKFPSNPILVDQFIAENVGLKEDLQEETLADIK
jgi:hypothetical protein